jgi:hypothetical protein
MECLSPTEADATGADPAAPAPQRALEHKEKRSMALNQAASTPEAQPGSKPVLMAEVRYAIVFAEMNELVCARVHKLLLFLVILSASLSATGFVTLLTKAFSETTVIWWALGLAAVAAVSSAARSAFKLDKRAVEYAAAKKKFQKLEGEGWTIGQVELQNKLAKLRADAPSGGSWLASAAYNKACEELGHPEFHMRVPAYVRFVGGALAS